MTPITREAWECVEQYLTKECAAWKKPVLPSQLGLRVVDGVVVPREPTEAMLIAAKKAESKVGRAAIQRIYKTTLSAAQKEQP